MARLRLPVHALAFAFLLGLATTTASASEVQAKIQEMLDAAPGIAKSRIYSELINLCDETHIPVLLRAIQGVGDDTNAGLYLIYTLQRVGTTEAGKSRAVAALKQVLEHEQSYLVGRAAYSLSVLGDTSWLADYLAEVKNPAVEKARRISLLSAFTSIRNVEVLEQVAALYDEIDDDEVRAAILNPLSYSDDPRFVPVYRKAMLSDGEKTRAAAIKVLVASADDAAIAALEAAVESGEMASADLTQVLYALRRVRALAPAHERLLLKLLQGDHADSVLTALIPEVARANDRGALPKLHEHLKKGSKAVAAAALEAILVLETADDLRQTLAGLNEHDDPKIRFLAAKGLVGLGDRDAVASLAKFLDDEDSTIRRETAEAFQEHMSRTAIPHLIQSLTEEDAMVRTQLERALQGHLRAFFPYRTPDLVALGLTPEASLATRKEVITRLETWFAARTAK